MKRQTSSVVTAPAGTGKSYMMVHDLVSDILPCSDQRVFTNLYFGAVPEYHSSPPEYDGETFAERIGKYVANKHGGTPSDYSSRLLSIERDWLDRWKSGRDPVELKTWDVANSIIILDESHNFAGSKHTKSARRAWQEFCGELRHRGACIVFVTQAPSKLAPEVIEEAGKRFALVDAEEERDPFFNIQMFYWYQLRAKLSGSYKSAFVRIELRDIDGRKSQRSAIVRVQRQAEIFALYDSVSAPEAGGSSSAARVVGEWQRRSWPSLLSWFFVKNFEHFVIPVGTAVLVVCLLVFGKDLMRWFSIRVAAAATKSATVRTVEPTKTVSPLANALPASGSQVSRVAQPIGDQNREQIEKLQRKVTQLESELAEQLAEASELRVITPERCVFGAGYSLSVGETVENGSFAGQVIKAIDYPRRRVSVGDKWVRLAAGEDSAARSNVAAPATVAGPASEPAQRAENNVGGVQSASAFGGATIGDGIRPLNSGRSQLGR